MRVSSFLLELSMKNPRPLRIRERDREPWTADYLEAAEVFSFWVNTEREFGRTAGEFPDQPELTQQFEGTAQFLNDLVQLKFDGWQPPPGTRRQ